MRVVLGLTVLALPSVALPGPAYAADSTISGRDGVRYDSCRYYVYDYSIDTSAGWPDWDADVTLYDPEGSLSDSDWLYKGGDPATGRSTFFICTYEPAGRYRVTIKVTYYDSWYTKWLIPIEGVGGV